MRRLDLHPDRKLRNPGRHLRALARWPERIVAHIPTADQLEGQRYWNFKVPVFAKLVEGRHATDEARAACLAAIFAAAEAIERSDRRPAGCRIACLVTTPFMFESEVTIFPDEDYFRSFLPVKETKRTEFEGGWIEASPEPVEPARLRAAQPSLRHSFGAPAAPAEMHFFGGTRLVECNSDWGDKPIERINWVWAFPRR